MSRDRIRRHSKWHGYTLLSCLYGLAIAGSVPVLAADPSASAARNLELNTTLREYGDSKNISDFFRIKLSESGILTLDVSATKVFQSAPRLLLKDQGEAFRVVHRTPRSLVLDVTGPGTFFLRVLAEDPRNRIAGYKLRNAFVADRLTPDEVRRPLEDPPGVCGTGLEPLAEQAFAEDVFARTCDEVDELDCDGFSSPVASPGVLVAETGDSALQAMLFERGVCDHASLVAEDVLVPGRSRLAVPVHPAADYQLEIASYAGFAGHYTLDVKFFDVCRPGETDDHGDTPLCASQLDVGEPVSGVVANGFGDDEDFFTFLLDELKSVVIEARSHGVVAALYDDAGQRLTAPGVPSPRIARTLGPGRYFVRITGLRPYGRAAGPPGAYTLDVTTLD